MITLDGLVEHDIHDELPSLNEVLDEIKETAMAALRYIKKGVNVLLVSLMLGTMSVNAQNSFNMTNLLPNEIVIVNDTESLTLSRASDAYPQHDRLYTMMHKIKSLDENWDGFGALKISDEALLTAHRFAEVLSEEVISHCSVFPAANSNVYLQGRFSKGTLIANFSGKEISYLLKGEGGVRMTATDVRFYSETVKNLNDVIVGSLLV